MGTPLAAALRAAHPTAHITWMVEHGNREAIDANPCVDEVLLWDGDYWHRMRPRRLRDWLRVSRHWFGASWLIRSARFHRELRSWRFDTFVSFHPEQWAWLLDAAAPTATVGVFDTEPPPGRSHAVLERSYQTAYTKKDFPAHQVDKNLLPLRALGLPPPSDRTMSLGYAAEDGDLAARFLEAHGLTRFVILAPHTNWPSKCWPLERYGRLSDLLASEGLRVVMTGTEAERDSLNGLAAACRKPPVVAAGVFTFRGLAALIDRAALVVSGDSAPMHAAAALGVPYVSMFGPTPASRYAPRSSGGVVLSRPVPCGPCGDMTCRNTAAPHLCLNLLEVQDVFQAALDLLGRDGRA